MTNKWFVVCFAAVSISQGTSAQHAPKHRDLVLCLSGKEKVVKKCQGSEDRKPSLQQKVWPRLNIESSHPVTDTECIPQCRKLLQNLDASAYNKNKRQSRSSQVNSTQEYVNWSTYIAPYLFSLPVCSKEENLVLEADPSSPHHLLGSQRPCYMG